MTSAAVPGAHGCSRRAFLSTGYAAVAGAATPASQVPADASTVTARRLSWAGVSLSSRERTVFVDPWVTASIWDGAWTAPTVPVAAPSTPSTVLVTHLHNDHFDPPAIRAALEASTSGVGCHRSMAPAIAARGFRPLPVDLFEPLVLDRTTTAIPVPAVDGVAAYDGQVSWVVRIGNRRVIHCGDTMYHGQFIRIGRAYGPFDLAFLPINGAQVLSVEPHPGLPMSMTPEQAIGAAISLGARLVVPIHYGLHDPKAYLEYPDAVARFLETAAARSVAVRVCEPGHVCPWPA